MLTMGQLCSSKLMILRMAKPLSMLCSSFWSPVVGTGHKELLNVMPKAQKGVQSLFAAFQGSSLSPSFEGLDCHVKVPTTKIL